MKNFSKPLSKNLTVVIYIATVFLFLNQEITACSWDYLIWENRSKNSDPYYRFVKNGKAGFINQSGKIVIKPTLWLSGNYQDGVINGLLEADYRKYVDVKTGKEVSKDFYEQNTKIFSDGLSVKVFKDRFGFDAKFGFIDRQDKTVIESKYGYAKEFSEGFAAVAVEGPCSYHNPELPCAEGTQQYAACKFSFISKKGKLISTQTFLDIKEFSEGLAPVKTAEGWGYIDKSGKMVIAPQFEEAQPFSEGLGMVKRSNLLGYINSSGTIIIEPQFEMAGSFSNGLAYVGKYKDKTIDNEFYFIDKNGKYTTTEKFLLASNYFKGIAHVLVTETLRSENKEGKELEIRTRTYAYINTKGEKIFTYVIEDEM